MIRSSFNIALRKQRHFYLFAKRARFFMVTIKKSRPKNLFPPVSLSLKKRVLPEPHPNWSASGIDIDIDTLFYVVHMLSHTPFYRYPTSKFKVKIK